MSVQYDPGPNGFDPDREESFGMKHPTIVPTNFEGEPERPSET